MTYKSSSPEETAKLAEEMAQNAKPGDIICLSGPLGAGKTAFAKGFARGLGVAGHVNSPTFMLMQIYESGRLPMYHFDLYRLAEFLEEGGQIDYESLEDIGFLDYLEGEGVCLVEWAEFARDAVPDGAVWVEIRREEDGSFAERRTLHIRGLREFTG